VTIAVRILLLLSILHCLAAAAGEEGYLSVRQRLYGQLEPTYSREKLLKIDTLEQLPYYRDMRFRPIPRQGAASNVQPTGFFRTEKRDDRWWLIDPYGHQRLSIAVNSVRLTPKQPLPGEQLHEVTGNALPWESSIIDLWESAGFNGFGAWSELGRLQGALEAGRDHHYAVNLNLLRDYLKASDGSRDYLPVFEQGFMLYARSRMREMDSRAGDPRLLGYFSDNELPFWHVDPGDYLAIEDEEDANYRAVLAWLSDQSLDAARITSADRARFRVFVLQQYLEVVTAAIAGVDANHLILGPRLFGPEINNEPFLRMLGRYVDVVSINFYQKLRPDRQQMRHWEEWSGRPFLISEFSIKAADSGKANGAGAGWLVETQSDRGLFYQHFTLGLLESRNCVGFHWYRYRDSPGDSGANKGIVSVALQPYIDLLENMGAINRQVYFLVDYFDNRQRP
jgi:hypothetical protein